VGKRTAKPKYRPYSVGGYRLQWYVDQFAARWEEDGQRRRFRLGETEEERARSALHAFVRQRQRSAVDDGDTLNHIAAAYISDRRDEGRQVQKMIWIWNVLGPVFGPLRAPDVSRDFCRTYVDEMRKAGRAENTINTRLSMLRTMLTWAQRNKLIVEAPYVFVPPPSPPRDRHLTRADLRRLLDACELPHIRLFIVLAISTAARMQALLGLTWDRIDFKRGIIDLRDPAMPTRAKGRAIVPMNDTARAALLEAKAGALSPFVVEWSGKRVGSIKKAMGTALRRAGIKAKGDGAHVLRHSAAVWMAEDRVPITEIAQYLGHSNPMTTYRIYARYSPDYLRKAAGSLNMQAVRSVG
jgi:integrase